MTIDVLGEYITRLEEAEPYKKQYIGVLEQLASRKINGNISLKPSMFGLLLNKEACYDNIREIVAVADRCNSFIRIDMEDATCTDDELLIYQRLKMEFPSRVGLVIQAYLRRTLNDIKHLMEYHTLSSPLNFRLCKGIYVEDSSVAFKGHQEIRDHYLEDLEFLMLNGVYVGIATHDKYLVAKAMELIEKNNIPKENYEFQMLYGVAPKLRRAILAKGHPMKVYVPFGEQWFNYSTRRLKENPHMVWHIIKALFAGG